jgi:PhnB protein
MPRLNPHLNFNGDCAAAFRFYQEVFGAPEPYMMTFAESPMGEQVPEPAKAKIMHASLQVGPVTLMGADAPELPGVPESAYRAPQGMSVSINVDEPAEAERLFARLSEGGSVQMPLAETFWSPRFGMCTDRFGIPWMVNCEGPRD